MQPNDPTTQPPSPVPEPTTPSPDPVPAPDAPTPEPQPTPGPEVPQTSPPVAEPGDPTIPAPENPQPNQAGGGLTGKMASPKLGLLLFAVIFAGAGGYFLVRSFASTLANERQLIKAFQAIGNDVSQIDTTIEESYKGGTAFKSASVSAKTKFYQEGQTSTVGKITIAKQAGKKAVKKSYAFDQLSEYYNYYKIQDLTGLIKELPAGNSLRKKLEEKPAMMARLNNNWYSLEGNYKDSSANLPGFQCLTGTPLLPNQDDINAIAEAYMEHMPLKVAKLSASPDNSGESYMITVKSQNDLKAFLDNTSGNSYFSGLNDCSLSAFNSNAKTKLLDAAVSNNLSATVRTDGQRVTQVTFKVDAAKNTTIITSNLTYATKGKKAPVPNWQKIGDGHAWFNAFNNPNLAIDNNMYKISLPAKWTADFCPWDNQDVYSLVYPLYQPKDAYCGYDKNARTWISSFQYDYNYEDIEEEYPPAEDIRASGRKLSSTQRKAAINEIGQDEVDKRNPRTADLYDAGVKKKKGSSDQISETTVMIDGKTMNRVEIVYGKGSYLPAGTKEIYYYYHLDEPSGDYTGRFAYFYAGYWQEPKQTDYSVAFDKLVKSTDLTW
jgi:hypothetical protein